MKIHFLTKVFGTKHDRDVKKMQPLVDQINQLALEYQGLSDDELRGKTAEFRSRIAEATADARERLKTLREELDALGRDDDRTDLLDEIGGVESEIKDLEQDTLLR